MMNDSKLRVLAIDYGTKRVGIALSDPMCLFPSITDTLGNDKNLINNLLQIIIEKNVGQIIIGYPDYEEQKTNELTSEILKLKKMLEMRSNLNIQLWDEHMTSKIAAARVFESTPKKNKRRNKSLIDAQSAAVILEEYLKSLEKK